MGDKTQIWRCLVRLTPDTHPGSVPPLSSVTKMNGIDGEVIPWSIMLVHCECSGCEDSSRDD